MSISRTSAVDRIKRRDQITVLSAMMAVQVLVSLSALALPAIAPAAARTLGRSTALIGYQISLVYAGAMVTSLLGGAAVHRWGACRVSQASLALSASGVLLITVPSLIAIVIASLIIGLSYGLTNPSASHLLSQVTSPANRNAVFSIKQSAVPMGGAAAGLILPHFAVSIGWQIGLILVAVAALAMLAAIQPLHARWDADREPAATVLHSPFQGFAIVWRHRPLRWLSLAAFCFAMIQLCLATFTPSMLVEDLDFKLTQAGIILALLQVAGIVGRLFWGWTADRLRSGPAVLIGLTAWSLVSALAIGAMGANWPVVGVSLLIMAFGLTANGWNGVFLAEVSRLSAPGNISTATGGALFFTFGGVLCGPSLFAFFYGRIGSYTTTYQLLALVAAAGIFCLLQARRFSVPGPRREITE